MNIPAQEAFQNALKARETSRYPNKTDPRFRDGMLFPSVKPSFELQAGQRIFTIGSCFARNVEDFLTDFDVPTRRFSVPKSEWASRPNGLLNEYNAGTIGQRMTWAIEGRATADMPGTLVGPEDDTQDLLLPTAPGVDRTRALERRREIDAVYAELPGSRAITITLGLTECWYDSETATFLNRMPPAAMLRRDGGRYRFCNLEFDECVAHLEKAMGAVLGDRDRHIILTVSPVPLQTTFTGQDCVTANARSKAVLRAVADRLCKTFAGRADYFPSYEIALSGGLRAFCDDNVHVRVPVVRRIVDHLFATYLPDTQVSEGAA